jgi:chromosome partitioning protein
MKTIVIANRKGGTGKTTVAYNLGASYALEGKRICYIDLDSQANLTMLCKVKPASLDEFKGGQLVHLSGRVSILPATKAFQAIENEINTRIDRNTFLREEILPKLEGFDYLIVDTSPSLSILNINAFCIADMVHIIVNADTFSLVGLVEMRTILSQVKAINPLLDWRIVLNSAHKDRKFTKATMETLRKEPGFAGIEIPNRQHVIDANARLQPALDFDEIRDPFKALAAVL